MVLAPLQQSQLKQRSLGGYSSEVPPLPIPNREVKLTNADGTAYLGGRVGSRLFKPNPIRVRLFLYIYLSSARVQVRVACGFHRYVPVHACRIQVCGVSVVCSGVCSYDSWIIRKSVDILLYLSPASLR